MGLFLRMDGYDWGGGGWRWMYPEGIKIKEWSERLGLEIECDAMRCLLDKKKKTMIWGGGLEGFISFPPPNPSCPYVCMSMFVLLVAGIGYLTRFRGVELIS
ncbi:hypothetical protein BO70DRAFT_97985 [Aspergillus heteromorphus CBS 117.55]|uniref:Uncharacterized protein n=1 Tax=Aspergillus heteromorphus CBS 117.55 TaxID=1448321 RepID=A0A317VM84_9EURO|nr:uncharacterized protein BO70DRAFT_97985 [Aspergillus heteromorphus CBS 117.55]PWY75484.1 hypothetical protein BO70DRAFT_97985 [Aspergillus heteromorphus CBS 117.55]